MSEFLQQTMTDIRRGRDSWRVVVSFSTAAFAIAVVATLAQQIV